MNEGFWLACRQWHRRRRRAAAAARRESATRVSPLRCSLASTTELPRDSVAAGTTSEPLNELVLASGWGSREEAANADLCNRCRPPIAPPLAPWLPRRCSLIRLSSKQCHRSSATGTRCNGGPTEVGGQTRSPQPHRGNHTLPFFLSSTPRLTRRCCAAERTDGEHRVALPRAAAAAAKRGDLLLFFCCVDPHKKLCVWSLLMCVLRRRGE